MNPTGKVFAFLSTSAFAASAAHGAILHTPINITISGAEALDLDLNQDGTPDYQIQWYSGNAAKPYIFQGPSGSANTSAFVLANASQGLPVTGIGTTIDGSYESAQTAGYFDQNGGATVVGGWTTAGNIEGYVGLELTNGVSVNYGWAHFIYNATGVPANSVGTGTLTLVDTAMEMAPGVGILTGQTAETGTTPVVEVLPSSQTNYLGGTAQLSVIAAGNPAPSFQWRAGAVNSGVYTNVTLGARATDATANTDGAMNTLTLYNLTPANMADYVVVVSNSSGAVTSSVPATLTVLPASDGPATLVHRYSFQDTAGSPTFADSVGGSAWAGTLEGDAALTGTNLVLDGSSGCYALLPSNMTSNYTQMTVEFWADIGAGNPVWTRVFSFGNQSSSGTKSSGVDYCPYAPNSYQNLDFLNTSGDDAYANNNTSLNGTTNNHITVVVDSVNDSLYYYNGTNIISTFHDNNLALNQTLVATSAGVPLMSLAEIEDVYNVIGASLDGVDPYLAGTIYEFRVYQGVLSPLAVALNDAVGPANYIQLSANPTISASLSGGNIILSWPASDFNFAVQSKSGAAGGTSWTTLTNVPILVGTNWQISVPSTGTARFFQLLYK
jgi:hypothetical protein